MFQRFHEMRERREGGFTLIELLVVILIIAILAAIAIPVFLAQRRKGWISQAQSALKNMATAQESFLTENPAYATTVPELEDQGFTYSADDVDPAVESATSTEYCLSATSLHDAAIVWYYDSDVGRPQEAAC
jgi:type IV pilus assembly protein PilA